jgi:uncharacterized membrane protein
MNRCRILVRWCQTSGGRINTRVARHLQRTLIAGSFLLIPIAITYLILRLSFDTLNGILMPATNWVLTQYSLEWVFPGLGVFVGILLVYLAGLFFANVIGGKIVRWGQNLTVKLPLIGEVYGASRKFVESFSSAGLEQTGFKRVVMAEYPRTGAWSIGFLTGVTDTTNGIRLALVYIPTAPLPNSGWVAAIKFEEVLDTDLTVSQAMQLVFSGGILSPTMIKTRPFHMEKYEDLAKSIKE